MADTDSIDRIGDASGAGNGTGHSSLTRPQATYRLKLYSIFRPAYTYRAISFYSRSKASALERQGIPMSETESGPPSGAWQRETVGLARFSCLFPSRELGNKRKTNRDTNPHPFPARHKCTGRSVEGRSASRSSCIWTQSVRQCGGHAERSHQIKKY